MKSLRRILLDPHTRQYAKSKVVLRLSNPRRRRPPIELDSPLRIFRHSVSLCVADAQIEECASVILSRALMVQFYCFFCVFHYAFAGCVAQSKPELPHCIALFGASSVPHSCLLQVLFHASALAIAHTNVVLRHALPLISRPAKHGSCVLLRRLNPPPRNVADARLQHSLAVSQVCSLLEVLKRLFPVDLNAQTLRVAHA
mmetsp:Transcript_34433/g.67325  ORF Transcript_34433/g.67325 Transcript_34433/m.67325 type:complete len:200 (-) Transcript_34433:381-980(-)